MRIWMLLVGFVAALLVLGALLIPQGEIVTLYTRDASGGEHATQLWIVELDGVPYLRASSPDHAWLARLRADPRVELALDREGHERVPYRATPIDDPAVRERVSAAMARKYGSADTLWSWVGDRSRAVPVRLDPLPSDPVGAVRAEP